MSQLSAETFREFLEQQKISYTWFDHRPVFTCEEVKALELDTQAVGVKNLFLYDPKTERHFLVLVGENATVDLKSLGKELNGRLSFGSAERLQQHLKVTPGAVTVFSLLNDPECAVRLVVDSALWSNDYLQFHPLVNTATVVVSKSDVERVVALSGHAIDILDIPTREL